MPKIKQYKNENDPNDKPKPKRRHASTPEGRENQMISLAMDLVEERLRNGTATSQETTHFLKLGSTKARLEREKLEQENKLMQAKTEALESQKRVEELYANALSAMRTYSGQTQDEEQ